MVISFGTGGRSGRAFNVIADQVRLLGTVRCLDVQQHTRSAGLDRGHGARRFVRSGGGQAAVQLPLHCPTGAQRSAVSRICWKRCAVELPGPRPGAAGGATLPGGRRLC